MTPKNGKNGNNDGRQLHEGATLQRWPSGRSLEMRIQVPPRVDHFLGLVEWLKDISVHPVYQLYIREYGGECIGDIVGQNKPHRSQAKYPAYIIT